MTSTGPASLIAGTGASAGPIATVSNRDMTGGLVDEGTASDVEETCAGSGTGNGSTDIAMLEVSPGLVFSIPTGSIVDAAGNVGVMGDVAGIETSLRRPLCEPAPIVVPLEASSSLISSGCERKCKSTADSGAVEGWPAPVLVDGSAIG